jgi:hypothetical protein
MYWLLTLRFKSKNGHEIWSHAITEEDPLSYLYSLEDFRDQGSYYLVNALQISKEDALKRHDFLHTE